MANGRWSGEAGPTGSRQIRQQEAREEEGEPRYYKEIMLQPLTEERRGQEKDGSSSSREDPAVSLCDSLSHTYIHTNKPHLPRRCTAEVLSRTS